MEIKQQLDDAMHWDEQNPETFHGRPIDLTFEFRDGKEPAIVSGIGDQNDLLASIEEGSISEPFQYMVRPIGEQETHIQIYPEIEFEYDVHYEGEIENPYEESMYGFQVDAYPETILDFTIKQTTPMPLVFDADVELLIEGSNSINTMKYALEFDLTLKQTSTVNASALFNTTASGEGIYIGNPLGAQNGWKVVGTSIQEIENQNYFSGSIRRGFFDKKDYEIDYEFKPIYFTTKINGQTYQNCKDDDLIGFIFRAIDERNFYILFIESDEQYYHIVDNVEGAPNTNRFSDILGKTKTPFHIVNAGHEQVIAMTVNPTPYYTSDDFETYKTKTGWKTYHKRIYRVKDNVLTYVDTPILNNKTKGWTLNQSSKIIIQCIGNRVNVIDGSDLLPIFSFDCEYDHGSYGVCNISQAVQFDKIVFSTWTEASGRWPKEGWNAYNGIGEIEYDNGKLGREIVQPIATEIAAGKPYWIKHMRGIVEPSTQGDVIVTPISPLILNAFNGPGAGKSGQQLFSQKKSFSMTSKHQSEQTAFVVTNGIREWFDSQIELFFKEKGNFETVTQTYQIKSISSPKVKHALINQSLSFWASEFPNKITEQSIQKTICAFEGWKSIAKLNAANVPNETRFELIWNEPLDPLIKIEWASKTKGAVTTYADDELFAFSNQFYRGAYQPENIGTINTQAIQYVSIPSDFIHPDSKEVLVTKNQVYYAIEESAGLSHLIDLFWKSNPSITTNNQTNQQMNEKTNTPLVLTKLKNDQIGIALKPSKQVSAWRSGVYRGKGRVNGKFPFLQNNDGYSEYKNVFVRKMAIPEHVKQLKGPIVSIHHPGVYCRIINLETVDFYSHVQSDYAIRKSWKGNWLVDGQSYQITNQPIEIINPISINWDDSNSSIRFTGIEAHASSPFVKMEVVSAKTNGQGLLGTYAVHRPIVEQLQEQFVVGGTYQERIQSFTISEEQILANQQGTAVMEWFAGGEVKRGTMAAKQQEVVLSVYVPANESVLLIAASFFSSSSLGYADLLVESPNQERFGYVAHNGSWLESGIVIEEFANEKPMNSASRFSYSGNVQTGEWMKFEQPISGTWKITVVNPYVDNCDYVISTSIDAWKQQMTLSFLPATETITAKINETEIDVEQSEKTISWLNDIQKGQLLSIAYQANQYSLAEQSLYTFILNNEQARIIRVVQNEEELAESATNGYIKNGKQLMINGNARAAGTYRVHYAIGESQRVFYSQNQFGNSPAVYINQQLLLANEYLISSKQLIINEGLTKKQDVITIRSQKITWPLSWEQALRQNEVIFNQSDETIDFDWSSVHPIIDQQTYPFAAIEDVASATMTISMTIRHSSVQTPATFTKTQEITIQKPTSASARNQWIESGLAMDELFLDQINYYLANKTIAVTDLSFTFMINQQNGSAVSFVSNGQIALQSTTASAKVSLLVDSIPLSTNESFGDSQNIVQKPVETYAEWVELLPKPKPIFPIVNEQQADSDAFTVHWRGFIQIPAGEIRFRMQTNGFAMLRVNQKTIIDSQFETRQSLIGYYTSAISQVVPIEARVFISDVSKASCRLFWKINEENEVIVPSSALSQSFSYQLIASLRSSTPIRWNAAILPGYYYQDRREYYLYAKKKTESVAMTSNQGYLSELPIGGAPILLKNNNGVSFSPVSFIKNNDLTLTNEEEFTGFSKIRFDLQQKNIDLFSLRVWRNHEELDANEYRFDPIENHVSLTEKCNETDIIKISYRVQNSFLVRYEEHSNLLPPMIEAHGEVTPLMTCIYETSNEKYVSNDAQWNPLFTNQHEGFLYLSHRPVSIANRSSLYATPAVVTHEKEPVSVCIKVWDIDGNPCMRHAVELKRNGSLIATGLTNRAGEFWFLDVPHSASEINRYETGADHLYASQVVQRFHASVLHRFSLTIKLSKQVIIRKQFDEVTMTCTLKNEQWQGVSNQTILLTLRDATNQSRNISIQTNANGIATYRLSATEVPLGPIWIQAAYDYGSETTVSHAFLKAIG